MNLPVSDYPVLVYPMNTFSAMIRSHVLSKEVNLDSMYSLLEHELECILIDFSYRYNDACVYESFFDEYPLEEKNKESLKDCIRDELRRMIFPVWGYVDSGLVYTWEMTISYLKLSVSRKKVHYYGRQFAYAV